MKILYVEYVYTITQLVIMEILYAEYVYTITQLVTSKCQASMHSSDVFTDYTFLEWTSYKHQTVD